MRQRRQSWIKCPEGRLRECGVPCSAPGPERGAAGIKSRCQRAGPPYGFSGASKHSGTSEIGLTV